MKKVLEIHEKSTGSNTYQYFFFIPKSRQKNFKKAVMLNDDFLKVFFFFFSFPRVYFFGSGFFSAI